MIWTFLFSTNPKFPRWTIKARVTSKSDLKHWSNAKGEGTLFSIDLLDSNGGEIRGTFFKEAATKFFGTIMEGQVYTFSGGVLKIVQNRQYTTIKNQYEITFNQSSEIKPASDDSAIKTQSFNFVKLNQIGTYEVGATIDVIAVVRQASEVADIVSTKMGGKALRKRDLQLIDDSGFEIKLTLWGDKAAQEQNWISQPIVAIKGVKIGDYGGRSLSTLNSSAIFYDYSVLSEYHVLMSWKNQFPPGGVQVGNSYSTASAGPGGAGGNESFDKRKTMASIKDEAMGLGEKPDYIVLKGSVVYIKHDNDPWYTACPTDQCNKKVTENMSNDWFCEKCNKSFPQVSSTALFDWFIDCLNHDSL
jgi:replication factor A1